MSDKIAAQTRQEITREDAARILATLPAGDDVTLAVALLPVVIADGNVTAQDAADAALRRVRAALTPRVAPQGARPLHVADAYNVAPRVTVLPMSDEEIDDVRTQVRGYCFAVDATRSRKRAFDAWEDAAQDAALIFADLLRKAGSWEVAACDVETQAACAWQYLRKDADESETRVVTRRTLRRWACHDAARRNGFRADVAADEIDATPGAQVMRGITGNAQHWQTSDLRTAQDSQASRAQWEAARRMAGATPVVDTLLMYGAAADDLGRAPIWRDTAMAHERLSKRNARAESRVRAQAEIEAARIFDALSDMRAAMPSYATPGD
jgi:galactarate dehydratase